MKVLLFPPNFQARGAAEAEWPASQKPGGETALMLGRRFPATEFIHGDLSMVKEDPGFSPLNLEDLSCDVNQSHSR